MKFQLDSTGTLEGLQNAVKEITNEPEIKGLMILAADDNGFEPATLDPLLQQIAVPVFGGTFPQIIYGNKKLTTGTIVMGFEQPLDILLIENISSITTNFDDIIDNRYPHIGEAKTMFVLVDGISKRVGDVIESLFNIFGLELNYIGAGAGSLRSLEQNMKQMDCIITNQGLKKDAAVLAMLNITSGIGVRHGWDIVLSGPHRVTEAKGNKILTLDWKPAFEVYKEIIEQKTDSTISIDSFFDTAKFYPFGIAKLGSEYIVRDPFGVAENNGLIFNANIQQESFVSILMGDSESVIKAAHDAYLESKASFKQNEFEVTFIVDCISRVLYLEDKFSQEIEVIGESDHRKLGVLSMGEIANSGKDYLELYNKTCVVGCLAKGDEYA